MVRAASGTDAWGLQEQLLASLVDAVNVGNWQRGGNAKAPRPQRIPRPGVAPEEPDNGSVRSDVIGTDVRPVEEIRSIFDARRAQALRKGGD